MVPELETGEHSNSNNLCEDTRNLDCRKIQQFVYLYGLQIR
jgi:hypothetical protein